MMKTIYTSEFLRMLNLEDKKCDRLISLLLKKQNLQIDLKSFFEYCKTNDKEKGILLIANLDKSHDIIFQNLPLFCYKNGILLFKLNKTATIRLETHFGVGYFLMLFVPQSDGDYLEIETIIMNQKVDEQETL
ncbi:hypothetical protein EDEG_04115 [Edhazardia aedis USNM 41457]|uniref:Uncharacterized protein n=1 Tax=Edhazardia aedis (strain USNM 41457) TaxID=1003232 RepID=J9DRE8_EDHAE|nr:hypothetical protein EDEG_04115 [Edhazardia aedis USNM 41457]|eukprot:EJW05135.1 hypothetical protein EDEG_04115 [Edhazardia aedis USNM 41457]